MELSLLLQEMLIVAVRKSGTLSDEVAKLPPGASVAGTVTTEPGLTYENGWPDQVVAAQRLVMFGRLRLALSGPKASRVDTSVSARVPAGPTSEKGTAAKAAAPPLDHDELAALKVETSALRESTDVAARKPMPTRASTGPRHRKHVTARQIASPSSRSCEKMNISHFGRRRALTPTWPGCQPTFATGSSAG